MNFYVAILILKMEENYQHFQHIMLYYFKKGKSTTKMQKKDLHSVWRRCCDWWNVSKVVCEFHAGNFLLDDAPWSGRPVEVDSDQIKTSIETNQHYATQEIAGILSYQNQ